MFAVTALIVFGSSIFAFLKLCERAASTLTGDEMKRLSSIGVSTLEVVYLFVTLLIAYVLYTQYPGFAFEIYFGGVALFFLQEMFSYIRVTKKMQTQNMPATFMRWFRIANLVALVGAVAFFAMILGFLFSL